MTTLEEQITDLERKLIAAQHQSDEVELRWQLRVEQLESQMEEGARLEQNVDINLSEVRTNERSA